MAEFTREQIKDIVKEVLSEATPQEIAAFHRRAGIDDRAESIHHTIGPKRFQAASGDHLHDGTTGRQLLPNTTFSGSASSNTATILRQVTAALTNLGASDATTP